MKETYSLVPDWGLTGHTSWGQKLISSKHGKCNSPPGNLHCIHIDTDPEIVEGHRKAAGIKYVGKIIAVLVEINHIPILIHLAH